MGAHAKYAPSTMERVFNCPGSVRLSLGIPDPPETIYAAKGTEAHAALECILRDHFERGDKISDIAADLKATKLFPRASVDHVMTAVKEVMKLEMKSSTAKVLIEKKVIMDVLFPDTYGTVDVAIVDPGKTLTILDYKHGSGKVVEVPDNKQLLMYAVGIAHEYKYSFKKYDFRIVQPRAKHVDGAVRSWSCTRNDIFYWKAVFQRAIKKAEKENAALFVGEWCYFCKAKRECPAQLDEKINRARDDFPDIEEE